MRLIPRAVARRGAGPLLIYAATCLALVIVDDPTRFFGDTEFLTRYKPFQANYWYQTFVTLSSFRRPRPRHVSVISLPKNGTDQNRLLIEDVCEQRDMVSRLVTRLGELGARVIVLDKWYMARSCSDAPAKTKGLVAAIWETGRNIPVVAGINDLKQDELDANTQAVLKRARVSASTLVLEKGLFPLDPSPGESPSIGLVRLPADSRKAVFFWPAFPPDAPLTDRTQVRRFPTLAMVAAQHADPEAFHGTTRLAKAADRTPFVYAPFIAPESFPQSAAVTFLCGDPRLDWHTCVWEVTPEKKRLVNARVVIFGELGTTDMTDSPVGRVAGVFIQANAIESFLDDRFLLGVPVVLEVIFVLVGLVGVHLVYRVKTIRPLARLGLALGATGIVVGLVFVGTSILGIYVSTWPAVPIAALAQYVGIHKDRVGDFLKSIGTRVKGPTS